MADAARTNDRSSQNRTRRGRPVAEFGIDLDTSAGATTVVPRGELDALSAPVFAAVLDAVGARSTRLVVIDLSDVRFCNVAALRAMTELAARLHAVDGHVRLVSPAVLDRMLDAADLRSMFVLEDAHRSDGDGGHETPPHRASKPYRSVRPRMSSPHRLATGP